MEDTVFKAFMEQIANMKGPQKRLLIQELLKKTANPPLLKLSEGRICPICSSKPTRSHGSFGNKPRYICDTCGTTVNDGSHLITHRSRHPEKWPAFLELLLEGNSVRAIALQLEISPKTSFLWRKKVTSFLPELKGLINKKQKSNTPPPFVSKK